MEGALQGAEGTICREYPAAGAFTNVVSLVDQKQDQKVT